MNLPGTICLPTAPRIAAGDAHRRLGWVRQQAQYHRRSNGFPMTHRRRWIDTSELAQWLGAHGVKVEWI